MSGATREIKKFLTDAQLVFTQTENVFIVTIAGVRKLSTTCSLSVGTSALTINAFVARKPDENHEAVYRWLLERNLKMYGVAFAVDTHGDIYLAGRVPLDSIDETEIDRLVGCVAEYSDTAFNTILELGFATAIKKEWEWRVSRGESTANLDAFAHLAKPQP
ncbi:MAG: YbjN domain-containing protein [Candidatus Nanopelagicales bacterium]|jgi:hypothetical protein|nr:YbjN domain-containing protein [Actinomycetota bacterium]MDA9869939.1 YbjN domain-containing protein [bacterium]MDC1474358.1 YbjN domain-containing protein [Candidatus Nanopelagicales bacterium]NCG02920.1 YbjN domain-containing protein [Actinomycetales bacterium]MBT5181963.1 YbjN domain-containing protein [Actinomycetota bacterium]